MEGEVLAEEQIVDTNTKEVVDESNNQVEEKSYEELKKELEDLKKKNESAEEIAKRLKDEKSQSKRAEIEAIKQQELESKKSEFITNELENILSNNMGITDEQIAIAKDLGISKEELKLMAYEARDSINALYEDAGGKDLYFEMVDTVKEYATEDDINMFKQALGNPKTSKLALEALKYRYMQTTGKTVEIDNRIVPKASTESSPSAYKDMREYQADMRKMRSLPSGQQQSFYNKIQDKLNRSNLV